MRFLQKLLYSIPLFLLFFGAFFIKASAAPVVADSFFVGPPTPHSLGFRWYIIWGKGTASTCTLSYKKSSESQWKKGLDLILSDGDTVNGRVMFHYFAGSLLNLEPGTNYDANIHIKNPGGTDYDTSVTVSTIEYPTYYDSPNKIHVYPPGFSGSKLTPNYDNVRQAVDSAGPGIVVLVHAGTYSDANMAIRVDGTETDPLVIRAAGDGEAILEGPAGSMLINMSGRQYVRIEGLTLRGVKTAIYCGSTVGIVILNNKMTGVENGIICGNALTRGNFFMGNTIIGTTAWYPRGSLNNFGILNYGQGNVICYNTIKKFWDCVELAPTVLPTNIRCHPKSHCNDFYKNILSEGNDDCLEVDATEINNRVWGNLFMNAHNLVTAQPVYGGPCYFFRNCGFNTTEGCLKYKQGPTGLVAYNNTFGAAFNSQVADEEQHAMKNAHFRNNAFMDMAKPGGSNYVMEAGSPDIRTTMDYNGWLDTLGPSGHLLKWYLNSTVSFRCATLNEFFTNVGFEEHGVLLKFSDFNKLFSSQLGTLYDTSDVDFRIAGPGPVDKGVFLPTVTENYSGAAPDIGAFEANSPPPDWGAPVGGFVLPVKDEGKPQFNNIGFKNTSKSMLLSNFANIKSSLGKGTYSINIYDINGRSIFTWKDISSSNFSKTARKVAAMKGNLSNGFYIVQLESKGKDANILLLNLK